MDVRKLEKQDIEKYNRLAREVGTIFNTTDWLDIFGDRVDIFGIYDAGGEPIGGFHLYKLIRFGFNIYLNPPFTPMVGPFLKVRATKHVSTLDTWKDALTAISDFIEELDYAIVSFSLNRQVVDTQPFIWNDFKVTPRYTYVIDLHEDEKVLRNRMASERRYDLRKANRDGLRTERISDPVYFEELVKNTLSRDGLQVHEDYLKRLLSQFADEENSFSFVTYLGGQPSAGVFCVHDNQTAYNLLAGYQEENKHNCAGPLAVWQSILHAKAIGLDYFDFEGSMIPSIEKYFRRFGGKLWPFFRINKAKLPLEIMLKFTKRDLF